MNIVFVEHCATSSSSIHSLWRGTMLYKAIKRTGLHNVALINSSDLSKNSHISSAACLSSQLIVIEGSPDIDLLNIINYWKSRGKKVIVDIPMPLEGLCFSAGRSTQNSYSISQMYSNFQNQEYAKVDQSDRFRWGLHLADCILVSSVQQQANWQVTAPVKVIPEFIDSDLMRDTIKFAQKNFVIGVFSNSKDIDPLFQSVIDKIFDKYPKTKWLILGDKDFVPSINPKSLFTTLPTGISMKWPEPISLIDFAIIWDVQNIKGEFYQNLLEFMALKIPWAINDEKGYQDIGKYGLIFQNVKNWHLPLYEDIQKSIMGISDTEEGYLHAIGHNVEDHIHEVLLTFSDILKIPC